jgi:hypothetical protein
MWFLPISLILFTLIVAIPLSKYISWIMGYRPRRGNPPRVSIDSFCSLLSHSRQRDVGTGLGLTIVKEIGAFHGGEVGLRSTLGQGSEFYFELPCAERIEA